MYCQKESLKHVTKPCVDKNAIEHVLPKGEPQKHVTKPCVDKNAIEHVLPKGEPQKHVMKPCQEQDRACTAKRRASETRDEALCTQERNRVRTAKRRALETRDEALCRQEHNRARNAKKRALESLEDYSLSNRTAMTNKRSKSVSVECAISTFHAEVKLGPDFVCTCCHRMMYRKSVIACNRANYTKGADVIQMVFSADLSYISFDGKQWVCRTCDRALKRGAMPLQAKANGLQLCPVLSGLNALELRLICLRVPFMKMVALPTGKQRSIHGPAVNVPSKVDTICDVLPRLPSQTEMVPLKLKRKVACTTCMIL